MRPSGPSQASAPETRSSGNARAGAALVSALATRGVTDVVLSPGSRNTPLVLAASAETRIRTHVVLDERAAAFVALGLSRASGRPVALACTSGSAGAHYLPALVEADRAGVPLVVLTADRPPELHGCGAQQTVDQRRYFGAFVRASRDLCAPLPDAAWAMAAATALDTATRAPAGPVHLNIAYREPVWDETATAPAPLPIELARGRRRLDEAALAALADHLTPPEARRGLVFCGTDACQDAAPIHALARRLGWPLLAGAASGARFGAAPGDVVWAYDALVRGGAPTPEVVLQFGRAPVSKPVGGWLADVPRTVRVDVSGVRHDPGHGGGWLVEVDPSQLALDLVPHLPPLADAGWRARWAQAQQIAAMVVASQDEVLWEGAVARALTAELPDGHALHVASSMPFRDVDAFVPSSSRALRVFSSRGANGIDGTLATAAGEALAAGPLALLVGDLAFLHDVGGLLAAAELGADLTVVVVDNGGGGIFEHLPVAAHAAAFERCFLTPQRARLADLCAAVGASHARVDSVGALRDALSSALRRPRLDVVQVVVDRARNVALHHETNAAVKAALDEERAWIPSSTGRLSVTTRTSRTSKAKASPASPSTAPRCTTPSARRRSSS